MKLAIVSDLHFGDKESVWMRRKFDPLFDRLKENIPDPPVDYLVMLGDVLDFATSSYRDSYANSMSFFHRVHEIARDIIYVAGNHDYALWGELDYQIRVQKRIEEKVEPLDLMFSCPGILTDDDLIFPRSEAGQKTQSDPENPDFLKVSSEKETSGRTGVFLDNLVPEVPGQHRPRFWVCYPNLYMRDQKGQMILMTHGHYFEKAWSLCSELAIGMFPDKLKKIKEGDGGKYLPLKDMVSINNPICQISGTGVGQTGCLTPIVNDIQTEANERKWGELLKHVGNLMKSWTGEIIDRSSIQFGASLFSVMGQMSKVSEARFNEEFISDSKRRGRRYLDSSFDELRGMAKVLPFGVKPFSRLVWGHTHDAMQSKETEWGVTVMNCGGWIRGEEGVDPAVILYDSGNWSFIPIELK